MKNKPQLMPFMVTDVAPSVVGNGKLLALSVAAAMFDPKTEPIPPAEIFAENPAPSTTPFDGTVGGVIVDPAVSATSVK
jgi:hypothetical protein